MPSHRILTGNCLDLLPTIQEPIAAICTDPPWGARNNCDYTRFSGGLSPTRNQHKPIANDAKPFDPGPWLHYPKVVLFGYQFFAQHLPPGTVLVWVKKRGKALGQFLSDAELAWQKGGKGCYLFHHAWNGFDRETEKGQPTLHPTQKPVALFRWVLGRLKLPPEAWVLDPYCGSGSVGVACAELGLNYVGIDIEPAYAEIAAKRVGAAYQ